MKTVVLHIGHGKTGTSALQSFLASNLDLLKEHGVIYPEHRSFARARTGGTSSGNYPGNVGELFDRIKKELLNCPDGSRVLFSGEHMFGHREEILSRISGMDNNVSFEIIICVRNPLDMAGSVYQQAVKGNGETRPFKEFAPNVDFLRPANALASEIDGDECKGAPHKLFGAKR